jgi:nucleotide-binding universal stress UspA family protein
LQIYKKILVTIDCSDVDGPILDHVGALALQNNAQLVLLHVIHAHTIDQDRALRDKSSVAMETYLARMQAQGVDAHLIIKSGEPEREIIKEIETGDYDLVAMATHGHTFIGDILFGSVSDRLKHTISIPLLLLKNGG